MPDWKQSIRTPEDAQATLLGLVVELRTLDRKLADLAPATAPSDTGSEREQTPLEKTPLEETLYGTIRAVRNDLLADAIETLDRLTALTEEEALAALLAATDRRRGLRLAEVSA